MAQKETTTALPVEEKKTGFWSTKISGVSLPIYLIMVVVLIVAMALGKLPTNMIGPIAILVIFGNLFHFIGNKIPIVKSYLGGGSLSLLRLRLLVSCLMQLLNQPKILSLIWAS